MYCVPGPACSTVQAAVQKTAVGDSCMPLGQASLAPEQTWALVCFCWVRMHVLAASAGPSLMAMRLLLVPAESSQHGVEHRCRIC